ncbi:MAG: hypothetical protein STHCBS139747_006005 [Sporothrix thermara]
MVDAASNEETRLLRDSRNVNTDDGAAVSVDAASAAHRRRVIAVTFAMIILVDFAAFFLEAPQTSILEDIVCSRYYGTDVADGYFRSRGELLSSSLRIGNASHDCTAAPIQAELATINQLLNTFNRIPGFFVAIPLGIAADRVGRRPVLFLTLAGALLQDFAAKVVLWRPDLFAPRLIWLSSLAGFVGGSDTVASAIVFLVVADVAPPQQRAQLFFTMTACERIGEIVGTPVSTLLMYTFGPWVPYILSTVLTMTCFLGVFALMPETLRPKSAMSEPEEGEEAVSVTRRQSLGDDEVDEPLSASSSVDSIVFKFRPLLRRS